MRGLAVLGKGRIFAKIFDDDGQRFISAGGRGGARGAVRRREGVQDAVQGAARVRRADGTTAVCAAGAGAGDHGGGAGGRVADVAGRGRGGRRGGILPRRGGAARGLGGAGEGAVGRVVPGVYDPLRTAAGRRPAALHADACGRGGGTQRLRQRAERVPRVPVALRDDAARAPPATAAAGRRGAIPPVGASSVSQERLICAFGAGFFFAAGNICYVPIAFCVVFLHCDLKLTIKR